MQILIIQTAFIGDTILASSFVQEVKKTYPQAQVHFVLRKGNESVIEGLVDRVWIWEKNGPKTKNLIRLISSLRKINFDITFNLHRHFNSGIITASVRSRLKIGFTQNPLSVFYNIKVQHRIPHIEKDGTVWHEVQRNLQLIPGFKISGNPKLYRPVLPEGSFEKRSGEYFVVAPASVWFTKAWEEGKFKELVKSLKGMVYLIGANSDKELCDRIRNGLDNVENLCGKLSLLESAALMKNAVRVFVNDSAPLHLASAVNAPTTAIFCSTVPEFGYTPLSDDSVTIDVKGLSCRPCGLHGHSTCPKGNFKCSKDIEVQKVLLTIH